MDNAKEIKKTEELICCARKLREKFQKDRDRPRYHYVPPTGRIHDVCGTLFWKGRYHVFYQYQPWDGRISGECWGHTSSVDLVHWVHHPIALEPNPNGPDRQCFSGHAFINREGIPTIIYDGVSGGTCIATSSDDLPPNLYPKA